MTMQKENLKILVTYIGVDFLLIKQIWGGEMFLLSLVKLNNSISVLNFATKF